ncbi:hypothetical protein NXX20_08035 [Bacteroides stercoris]|nr:hypothetical protein [Bacteroides stercoris]
MKTAFVYKLIYRLILWASAAYFLTTAAGQLFALLLVVALFLLRGTACFRPCVAAVCRLRVRTDNHSFNILIFTDMETRTWTENGTPVSKEKTVAFSGHRTNRIAKFTADREKLFREVAFDTFAAIESYCIKKGYDTFLSGMCEGFDLIAAEEVLNLKKDTRISV